MTWEIKIAQESDFERWMKFLALVQDEFHGLDLVNDSKHRDFVLKNIKRETAIFIEDPESNEIIGAMAYSTNSNHISWLAVLPKKRRLGIGSSLVNFIYQQIGKSVPIKVKTFTETDIPGPTAQAFYRSVGFEPGEIEEDEAGDNAGKPYHVFWNDSRQTF